MVLQNYSGRFKSGRNTGNTEKEVALLRLTNCFRISKLGEAINLKGILKILKKNLLFSIFNVSLSKLRIVIYITRNFFCYLLYILKNFKSKMNHLLNI